MNVEKMKRENKIYFFIEKSSFPGYNRIKIKKDGKETGSEFVFLSKNLV